MVENSVEPVSWTSILRFWVVGGWTLIVVGGVLVALSMAVL